MQARANSLEKPGRAREQPSVVESVKRIQHTPKLESKGVYWRRGNMPQTAWSLRQRASLRETRRDRDSRGEDSERQSKGPERG